MKAEEMKKVDLGDFPTPLVKMENISRLHNASLFIKRDDVTGPALSGNKTRKLEYIIRDALDNGYTAILTTGGPGTNHGHTTIAAAARYGLKPILVRQAAQPDYLDGVLAYDALMGCDIISTDNLGKAVDETIKRYEEQGDKVYNLPAKSSAEVGAAGYIMCVREIMEQCEQMGITPSYLVSGAGSLGTYAGLVCGAVYYKAPFKVIGIPARPVSEERKAEYVGFINELAEFYHLNFTMTQYYLNIENGPADHPYVSERPWEPDSATMDAIFELARHEGIVLDPEYTGRAFRGFLDLVDRGVIKGNCIFLHTGGGQSVWTREQLDAVQEKLRASCHTI